MVRSPDYVSSLITGGLLVAVTILWATRHLEVVQDHPLGECPGAQVIRPQAERGARGADDREDR
jgi:hypothetical protein